MKFIIGKKLEMTQVWQGDQVVSVTKVEATPNIVVQVKSEEKDGYKAVQLGYGTRKPKNIAKPQKGHMKDLGNFSKSREFRIDTEALKVGDKISVETFQIGDTIDVVGTSKGKGFQGVVRRHGFHGQNKTHGNKDQLRMPGSVGATGPAHVFKGMRMPGRMGGDQVTTKNLEIVEVDIENNFVLIKGAVPGARNGLVLIKGNGELKIQEVKEVKKTEVKESVKEEKKEEVQVEVSVTETAEAKEEKEVKKEEKDNK